MKQGYTVAVLVVLAVWFLAKRRQTPPNPYPVLETGGLCTGPYDLP